MLREKTKKGIKWRGFPLNISVVVLKICQRTNKSIENYVLASIASKWG